MPSYKYECRCGLVFCARRPVEERAEPAECLSCGNAAYRTYSVPNVNASYINSEAHAENKFALGTSETERLATMKADDAQYQRNWTPNV